MRPTPILIVLVFTWLGCRCTASHAQSAAEWQARQVEAAQKSEAIMLDANKRASLLAQFQVMRYAYIGNKDPAFQIIFGQYLSWYQSFIGDYQDAATSFSIRQEALPDDRPSPLDNPEFGAEPALTAIPRLARNRRAVFFNEAHNIPLTRTLTVQLLGKLRAEGFNYFAAETVYQTDTGLQSRGYPTKDSGFYTKEPICAEMVRTALRLGYKVIGYEALSNATGNAREAEQARNIYQQVFKHDPNARLVVDAGYAHIQESGVYLGGSSMAEHLKKLIHIDPLTVEQTMLYEHPSSSDNHPYYGPVMQKLHPGEPLVFVSKAGKPWSLRPGYDVSVWFPPQVIRRGRPTWLGLGGERKPYYVDGGRCNRHFPCLVEARYANEGNDAIPADRVVLDPVPLNVIPTPNDRLNSGGLEPFSDLYLRPGKYRLTYDDVDGSLLFSQNITIKDQGDASLEVQPGHPGDSSTATAEPCVSAGPRPASQQAAQASCNR